MIFFREEKLYEKYNNQTQIVALPGGVKRNPSEVYDNNGIKKSNSSYFSKVMMDYNSAITCLQGPEVSKVIDIREYTI